MFKLPLNRHDAFNRAVELNSGSSHQQILYDAQGAKLAYMSAQTLQKYMLPLANGVQAVFNSSGISYYRHADWLGSSRLALKTDGSVYADQAYAPFGETYSETGTADRSFTGQTQDTTAGSQGVYDFLLRQQASNQGRWLVPDPAGLAAVDITNPQTWNRYAYVGNNPLSTTDPTGLRPPQPDEVPTVPGAFGFSYKAQDMGDWGSSWITSDEFIPQWYLDEVIQAQADLAHPNAPPVQNTKADYTIWVRCQGEDVSNYSCAPAPWSSKYFAPRSGRVDVGWAAVVAMLGETYRMSAGPVKGAAIATGAVVAAPVAIDAVGSLPTMQVAIGQGSPFHVAYGINGTWLHATGDFFNMTVTSAGAAGYVRGFSSFQFSLPVLNPQNVLNTAGSGAWSCASAACSAFLQGWIP